MSTYYTPAQGIYDSLWREAVASLSTKQVQLDPYLPRHESDSRRGMTLIARPSPAVSAQFCKLLDELKTIEPAQHFYQPAEFHITILAPLSVSLEFDEAKIPLAAYHAVFLDLFRQFQRFKISFKGISASTGAVMAQGYVEDDYLNQMRTVIRQELKQAGLDKGLDTRYKIVTAHATLMRFCAQPQNYPRLLAMLTAARRYDFGTTDVEQVEFVINDWYMSHSKVCLVATYPLDE